MPENCQADYVRSVRGAFLERACVSSAFMPADEKLAVYLYWRGVPLETLRQAIWLGLYSQLHGHVEWLPAGADFHLGILHRASG